jgi:hypothetical protein
MIRRVEYVEGISTVAKFKKAAALAKDLNVGLLYNQCDSIYKLSLIRSQTSVRLTDTIIGSYIGSNLKFGCLQSPRVAPSSVKKKKAVSLGRSCLFQLYD